MALADRRLDWGDGRRAGTRPLGRIHSTDVVLPTVDGRDLRLRWMVRPDRAQRPLLDRFGLDLPQRLRIRPALASAAQM